jgi:hypothetical protein
MVPSSKLSRGNDFERAHIKADKTWWARIVASGAVDTIESAFLVDSVCLSPSGWSSGRSALLDSIPSQPGNEATSNWSCILDHTDLRRPCRRSR